MQLFEGELNGEGHRYALVVSRFNRPISEKLLQGAIEGLMRHGVEKNDIKVAWVPGAFEIPLVAKKFAQSKKVDGVICLGAVIRGETAHFDFVAGQAASGILQASLSTEIPVIFSVITTETVEQAEMRAGTKGVNAGFSGAMTALEMVNLLKKVS